MLYFDGVLLSVQAGNPSNYEVVGTLPIPPQQGVIDPSQAITSISSLVNLNLF